MDVNDNAGSLKNRIARVFFRGQATLPQGLAPVIHPDQR